MPSHQRIKTGGKVQSTVEAAQAAAQPGWGIGGFSRNTIESKHIGMKACENKYLYLYRSALACSQEPACPSAGAATGSGRSRLEYGVDFVP